MGEVTLSRVRNLEKKLSKYQTRQQSSEFILNLINDFNESHASFYDVKNREYQIKVSDNNPKYQAEFLANCVNSCEYWILNWVWTYDPRVKPSVMPFKLFPIQSEYLIWREDRITNKEHGLVEKSRDSGASWLNVAHQLWCWLFKPGWKGTLASRKEMLVDRLGDPDSLFEKARMILRYLPHWMKPRYIDGNLKFINLDNGSAITGEAGDNVGRGGRSSCADIDEAAFLEQGKKVDAAISQNANTVIWTSTPNGSGNIFYRKRFSNKIPVFRFHWKDDPRKDQAWYNKQVASLDPVVLAQEIDIDYSASIEGIFIPAIWVQSCVGYIIGEVEALITAGLDVATDGKNRNVLLLRQGPKVVHIESWQGLNTTESAFKAISVCKFWGVSAIAIDGDGVGAGVLGTLATTPDLGFAFYGVHGSGKPSSRYWIGERKRSFEKFHNRRAENWGLVQQRIKKTYDVVSGLSDWSSDECIGLPNNPDLLSQISQPLGKYTSSGKRLMESKDDMKSRGIESPDYADALVLAFSIEGASIESKSGGNRSAASATSGY